MKNKSAIYSRYYTFIKNSGKFTVIKNYGSTIFSLLITAIFILFAIKPTIETILVLKKKLENSNQVLESLNKKATDISKAKNNFDALSPEIKTKINTAIPDSVNLSTIINNLEELVETNNSSISAIQFEPVTITKFSPENTSSVKEIPFVLTVEGAYQNIITLLQQLYTSSRVIQIDTVSLNKASEGLGIILSISGKAFYIK
jgi:Tfp pilus assembly protein PilO